jgi:uncharacterized cupin superfamily protein
MIINPENVPSRTTSNYPDKFKPLVSGRVKQALGNAAKLKNFGVNLVTLAPGSCSALRHWHTLQDEFIYVMEGEITLISNEGEQILKRGMVAGFPAGEENGHHLFTYRGKGEREEIIGRGLRGIPIIDTPLREGLQTRIGGKKRKKLLACCE